MNLASQKTKKIASVGVMSGISVILVMFSSALPFWPPWLKLDIADFPILIITFIFGPLAGLASIFVTALLQSLTIAADFPFGFIMHFIASGTFVIIAGNIYKQKRTFAGAIIGLLCGIISMTAVMLPLNLLIAPLFAKVEFSSVLKGFIETITHGGIIQYFLAIIFSCAISYVICRKSAQKLKTFAVSFLSFIFVMFSLLFIINLSLTQSTSFKDFGYYKDYIFGSVISFNLVKATLNGVIVFLIYKPLKKAFKSLHVL